MADVPYVLDVPFVLCPCPDHVDHDSACEPGCPCMPLTEQSPSLPATCPHGVFLWERCGTCEGTESADSAAQERGEDG